MTEQFVSQNNSGGNLPVKKADPIPLDMLANQELTKVLADGRVLQLMQYTATLHQLLPMTVIENQSQYDQVIDAFDSAKKLINLVEERRVEFVGFPTKVVKLINDLFKQMKGNVEIAKNHFGALIEAKKQFDAAIYARSQADGVTKEPQIVPSSEGVGKVDFGGESISPPSNVVSSAKGAKTHSRGDIEVTIIDLEAFLKVVVSKNKRYAEFNAAIGELVEVKIGPLKKLIKDGKKRTVPGVKIEATSKTV